MFRFCLLLIPITAAAQLGPVKLNEKLTAEKIYVGFSNVSAVGESGAVINRAEFRTGATLHWQLKSALSYRSFGVVRVISNESTLAHASSELIWQPNNHWKINAGYMATLITELRPNPATTESQSESNAQSLITGAKTGAKLKYSFNEYWYSGIGVAIFSDGMYEQFLIGYKNYRIALNTNYRNWNAAAELKTKRLMVTLFADCSKKYAGAIFIQLRRQLIVYTDAAFEQSQNRFASFGFRKSYSSDSFPVKGFLGCSINLQQRMLEVNLFIHL
jgi:hypothetical protein